MASKNKDEVNKIRKQMDDSLGNLLNDDELLDNNTDLDNDLPAITPPRKNDYVAIKSRAEEKAKKTIASLMKFYLDEDIIEQDEYIKARKKIDEMTLASLIFQLETAEKTLVTLMETIDGGELAPRMFEVLATLQKSMLDIIKSQTMYLMAAEESTKKISRDVEVYKGLKRKPVNSIEDKNGTSNINRGSKELMRNIQTEIKGEDAIKEEMKPEEIIEEVNTEPIVSSEIKVTEPIKTDDIDEDIDDEINHMDKDD